MALSPYSFTPAKGSGGKQAGGGVGRPEEGRLHRFHRAAIGGGDGEIHTAGAGGGEVGDPGGSGGAVGDADDLVIRGLELGVGDAHFQNGTGLIPQLHKVPGFEGTGGEERDAADHIGEGSLDCQGQGPER